MDFLTTIYSDKKKNHPYIFIERLIVYSDISEKVVLRQIKFSKGVNIIWANDIEDRDGTVDITGHGVGKTTLCGFIRHLFGEPNYSDSVSEKYITKSFPNGGMAGELIINGKRVSVIRYFAQKMSIVAENISLEEMIDGIGKNPNIHRVSTEDYAKKIGIFPDASNGIIFSNPRTGQNIDWSHILSWCTRDQEARYRNLWTWRESESQSKTSGYAFPKDDPIFVIKKVLGLFTDKEAEKEMELAKITSDLNNLDDEYKTFSKMPQSELIRIRKNIDIEIELLGLKKIVPEDIPLLIEEDNKTIPSVELLFSKNGEAWQFFKNKEKEWFEKDSKLQNEINLLESKKQSEEKELELAKAAMKVASKEESISKEEAEKFAQWFYKNQNSKCEHASIEFINCNYVKSKYQSALAKYPKIADDEAKKLAENISQEFAELVKNWENIRKSIAEINSALSHQKLERINISDEWEKVKRRRDNIKDFIVTAKGWKDALDNPKDTFKKLDEIKSKKEVLEKKSQEIKKLLEKLVGDHEANQNKLSGIYSDCVKNVLKNSGCDGIVNLSPKTIQFLIKRNGVVAGQAVGVLSILLADISALIYSILKDETMHPCFIIHDSPKEADLADNIYHSFINFIIELSEKFGKDAPFQYILTTTTKPPEEVLSGKRRELLKLELSEKNLFLGKNIFEDTPSEEFLIKFE